MDGVVEPPRKEVLALPPPSSPGTPPRPPAAEAQSPVTARTELAASGGEVNGEEWVTVFGFSPGDTNLVLREFEKCGVILRHHSGPRDGNWIHILYQLVESGEKEKLMELLRERLVECGWRDEMKALCRAYARKKGRNNVTVDDLIHVITPKGRATVPDSVKAELLQLIRSFLMSSSLW